MLVLADAEDPGPQGNLGGQIKRLTHRALDGLLQLCGRPASGINDVPAEVGPLDGHYQLLGIPSGAGNSVRRLSWRSTTSASAAPNAWVSRRPLSRNATAML